MHVVLPVPDAQKQKLLRQLGIACAKDEVRVPARAEQLDNLLLAARVHCLSKIEVYFLQSHTDLLEPINVRNEAAAISKLLQQLSSTEDEATASLLKQLEVHCQTLWPEFAWGDVNLCGREPPAPCYPSETSGPAAAFEKWAHDEKIGAGIRLASYDGLRGCAASRDLFPGDKVLSIPRDALIYEDTVRETDLGRMLSAIPNLPLDDLLILFTMVDRWDTDSKWAPLWASLPAAYYTGLSFPPELVAELAGTAAHLELQRAQAHLQAQYVATRPLFNMLLAAYPQFLEEAWFSYEAYLWAAELWYSYCFEVEIPGREGGSSVTVMVPFACHVNHSPWPHVVRYGRLDPVSQTLDYPAFRPCKKGQQVYISYGPVPNLKLICFYGFVIPNNPHDLVLLQLEPPDGELSAAQQAALDKHGLTLEHNLQDGPLSKQLLGCLRVIVGTEEELRRVSKGKADPLQGPLSPDNEEQALSTLEVALLTLLDPLLTSPLLDAGGSSTAAVGSAAAGPAAAAEGGAAGSSAAMSMAEGVAAAGGVAAESGIAAAAGAAAAVDTAAAPASPLGKPPLATLEPQQQEQQEQQQQGQGQPGSTEGAAGQGAGVEPEGQPLNENGLDSNWVMSRHFCSVYVQGQVLILQRALLELRKLAGKGG